MKLYHLFVSVVILIAVRGGGNDQRPVFGVAAYPFGSGHCSSGTVIANTAHGVTGSGSLRNGNYQLRVTTSTTSTTLVPGPPTFLSTGAEYTITLAIRDVTANNQYFRGFLFRLRGRQGEDVKDAMSISPEFLSSSQVSSICSSIAGVSGITHTNANDKTNVDVILSFDQPISQAQLEVTVVQRNNPSGSNLWHYDSYDLVVLQAPSTDAPTRNPSAEPTAVSKSDSVSPSQSVSSPIPSMEPTTGSGPTATLIPTTASPSSMEPTISLSTSARNYGITGSLALTCVITLISSCLV
eukprot:CAMPEP_0176490990 /NCGR_PEP_ID=MMETSP0200_2-20121128/8179_1 /TAXON_ID=947934 /ORGANISM="Chaetoceros sp., Strain GSL56" /LENGTH=295 /DNA_ID=CAMNT_0017888361 /DNA_START=162 /DNA_END=1049 /DNA_ORIENTATION=+